MVHQEELNMYDNQSTIGLKYRAEAGRIVIYNSIGSKIAELNLQYATERIYSDAWFGFVTEEEFKEVMSGAYLDYFIKSKCIKKVCNTLNMEGGMNDETSNWFNQDIFPKLCAAGMQYNALVIPEDIFAQQTIEDFEANLGNDFGRLFPTFEKALFWLRNSR
jgi:hypothetical protein